MAIVLFTDFGSQDPYVGQVKAVLARDAPGVPQVDLLNDVPVYNVRAAAHLLASLVPECPHGSVFLSVVDPGVGGPRAPRGGKLVVNGESVGRARVFSDVPEGQALWYENSQGLVEIAVNRGTAAEKLDLEPGTEVEWAS